MPDWSNNTLRIYGDNLQAIRDSVSSDYGVFDFNRIIPRPKELEDVISGGITDVSVLCYLTEKFSIGWDELTGERKEIKERLLQMKHDYFVPNIAYEKANELTPSEVEECYRDGRQYYFNMKNYGYLTWYGWSCDNWGTKWNSAETSIEDRCDDYDKPELCYHFSTAWSPPVPVIKELSKQFPYNLFILASWIESFGNMCEVYIFKDGNEVCADGRQN